MSSALELLTEACGDLPVVARKMFGGHGFFAPNGGMFAGIVTNDEVIFKLADAPAREQLVKLGGHPWTYEGRGKAMTMSEWIVVPDGFYDDAELFSQWAARAHQLAPAKKAKKSAVTKTKAAARKKTATAAPKKKR